jgi:hypothetical protein
MNNKEIINYEMVIKNKITIITKLFKQPNKTMIILIALYLFLTPIIVVKIINISKGPL